MQRQAQKVSPVLSSPQVNHQVQLSNDNVSWLELSSAKTARKTRGKSIITD